jgi:two-component system OmpR family sensor kinase
LLKHEKKAFWKFFTTYFGSVALLILASGFFYFEEQSKGLIEQEHLSMIEYARQLKMNIPLEDKKNITHTIRDVKIENFSMNNFKIEDNFFVKFVPYTWDTGFIEIRKDKSLFYEQLNSIKMHIIAVQTLLLFLFASISYYLSMRALKPMQDAITKLDNFSKDLIHDLNTPITSILLNMKILEKSDVFHANKAIDRIKRSVKDMSDLHNNLTILLQEETMIMSKQNISEIVEDIVLAHKRMYGDIHYEMDVADFYANINPNALKQVLVNLISNASKYNKKNGFVKIYAKERTLCIEDGGVGIRNTDLIFNRSYSEQNSGTGIGLDIAKRLCEAMKIEISAISEVDRGSVISLKFKN